jgi:hypothetical protein
MIRVGERGKRQAKEVWVSFRTRSRESKEARKTYRIDWTVFEKMISL